MNRHEPAQTNRFMNNDDTDSMTEKQLRDELDELNKLAGSGSMTPADAFRMTEVKCQLNAIANAKAY